MSNRERPDLIAKRYFPHVKTIAAAGISQKSEVRKMCEKNDCGFYNTNWTCPPAVAPLEELKMRFDEFDTFAVIYEVFEVSSSFDWKGMMASSAQFKKKMQEMKTIMNKDIPKSEFLVLGMGSCDICTPCSYTEDKPCRKPDDAIISLEACGIDVMKLMKDHGMQYYNGKNTITLVGGILFRKNAEIWAEK